MSRFVITVSLFSQQRLTLTLSRPSIYPLKGARTPMNHIKMARDSTDATGNEDEIKTKKKPFLQSV